MIPLYAYILVGSVIVPLLFSIFQIDFIKHWKNFTISTLLVAIVFLIWDAIFTQQGVWGFNEDYVLGVYFLNMPIEEWLFFIVIPFCSLFTHFAIFYAFPNLSLSKKFTSYLTGMLIVLSLLLVAFNFKKAYTAVDFSFLALVLILGAIYKIELLQQFYISFLVVLMPFIIVNGILTGALTQAPIVWYDDLENLGIRFITIPVEDFGYAFSMLFANLFIFDSLNKKALH